jgi:hypothetical protein
MNAFQDCIAVTNINIHDSVTSFGDYVFYRCRALQNINIPHGVTAITECSFIGCFSLQSVTIPASVTSISNSAFQYCNKLNIVYILSNELVTTENNAFSGISPNAILYTTTANINNTSLTQYFANVYLYDSLFTPPSFIQESLNAE